MNRRKSNQPNNWAGAWTSPSPRAPWDLVNACESVPVTEWKSMKQALFG